MNLPSMNRLHALDLRQSLFTLWLFPDDPMGAHRHWGLAIMKQSKYSLGAAMLVAAIVLPGHARADGGNFAAGLFGGLLGGAIVGSVIAPRAPEPVYIAPEPYYPEPVCFGRAQVFDSYYGVYRWQRVRVPCY
jgi:hypothetical protein